MLLTAMLSCSGDRTEKPACAAKSAEMLWTTISAGMARTSSLYSEPTGRPLKRKRAGISCWSHGTGWVCSHTHWRPIALRQSPRVFRFLSEDWSPWIALLRMRERWPELRYGMKAGYFADGRMSRERRASPGFRSQSLHDRLAHRRQFVLDRIPNYLIINFVIAMPQDIAHARKALPVRSWA